MNITLTFEQEKFIKQQLETGKYSSADEIINEAFSLLLLQEKEKKYIVQGGDLAQKKLLEKKATIQKIKEENNNKNVDIQRQKLAEEFRRLCAETQVLNADNSLTDEEIQAEIEAYRRGE